MAVRLLQGHAIDVLATLPAQSVHAAVTSPPFWGLRAYNTTAQLWGGTRGVSAACDAGDHAWGEAQRTRRRGQAAGDTATVGNTVKRVCPPELDQGTTCLRCGCWRGELGSEPTLAAWVSNLVEVFAAVRRALRDDGLLWVEVGDSYTSTWACARRNQMGAGSPSVAERADHSDGLVDRNLALAPFRLAMGLQQAGWTLRQVMALCRTAPMPESVSGTQFQRHRVKVAASLRAVDGWKAGGPAQPHTRAAYAPATGRAEFVGAAEWEHCPGCDRCRATDGYVQSWGSGRATNATSYLFQFCKDGARYYYDAAATREAGDPAQTEHNRRYARAYESEIARVVNGQPGNTNHLGLHARPGSGGRNRLSWQYWRPERDGRALPHYAQFPPAIPKLAIDAAPLYVCPECGAPLARVVDGPTMVGRDGPVASGWREPGGAHTAVRRVGWSGKQATGWRQTCACPGVTVQTAGRAVILDPFSGAGTTALVADRLGRDGWGIELSAEYHALALARVRGDAPLLLELEAEEVPAR